MGFPRCREVGFIQRLLIISTAVRSGLPDGLLLLLLPRHLSMLRVVRWGIPRFMMGKDENIGFDGYIGTWILRIYRRYIGYIGDILVDIFT